MNRCPAVGKNHAVMKTLPFTFLLLILFTGFIAPSTVLGIPITSSKGKTVEFAGVKSASPAGLEVQVKKGGPILTLPWARLDLNKLKSENPKIHDARIQSLDGKKVALNLGGVAPKVDEVKMPNDRKGRLEAQGIFEAGLKAKAADNFVEMRMAIKLPGGKVKGILLYTTGVPGRVPGTESYVARGIDITDYVATKPVGPWSKFALEQGMAIMGIGINDVGGGKKGPPYFEVSKGTGDALLRMIDTVADRAKRPELKTAPFVLYGRGVGGASFVYHLAQWKPERVAAVVAAKGAFYDAEPTEASAKVPILFLEGEYDDEWKEFKAGNLAHDIVAKHVALKPNWTFASERRGPSGDSLEVQTISMGFLKSVVPMRIGEDGLQEIDRSASWVGNNETKEISQAGGSTDWTADKTWLPDAGVGKLWKGYSTGTMNATPPE